MTTAAQIAENSFRGLDLAGILAITSQNLVKMESPLSDAVELAERDFSTSRIFSDLPEDVSLISDLVEKAGLTDVHIIRVDAPFSQISMWENYIYLPENWREVANVDQLRFILTHEIGHILLWKMGVFARKSGNVVLEESIEYMCDLVALLLTDSLEIALETLTIMEADALDKGIACSPTHGSRRQTLRNALTL